MKIEFGCGENPQYEGWKTCDVRNLPSIDYVCNAWDIDKHVEENSVDEITSRHFLEHLTFRQAVVYTEACYKILKPGGTFEFVIPNFVWHVRQWLTEENVMGFHIDNPFQRGMDGLWGKQRGELEELWDTHKAGYKPWQAIKLCKDAGFDNVEQIESSIKNLHIKAVK